MKKLISSMLLTFLLSSQAHSVVESVGASAPVTLPNGRDGARSIAEYRTVNQFNFNLSEAKSIMIFATSDLYMNACSSTGDKRCPYGELVDGNQRLVVLDLATNRTVFQEIFKYSLLANALYPDGTKSENKPAIKPVLNQTSTLHAVTGNLPSGRYQLQLQLKNDYNPMTVHPKRLSIMY